MSTLRIHVDRVWYETDEQEWRAVGYAERFEGEAGWVARWVLGDGWEVRAKDVGFSDSTCEGDYVLSGSTPFADHVRWELQRVLSAGRRWS